MFWVILIGRGLVGKSSIFSKGPLSHAVIFNITKLKLSNTKSEFRPVQLWLVIGQVNRSRGRTVVVVCFFYLDSIFNGLDLSYLACQLRFSMFERTKYRLQSRKDLELRAFGSMIHGTMDFNRTPRSKTLITDIVFTVTTFSLYRQLLILFLAFFFYKFVVLAFGVEN